jgi:L-amino acid N-acyltransferase YncA
MPNAPGWVAMTSNPSFSRTRTDIIAGVDAVNAASVRVLEKLGFEVIATQPGAFGIALVYRLSGPLPRE